ncbi:MAG: hypothetical protein AAB815_01770, partial [Patescibacteria group bacterium]
MTRDESITQAILEKHAQFQREHIRRKLSFGLCGWSGCRIRIKFKYYCPKHRAKKNAYTRKRNAVMRDSWVADNLCIQCGGKKDRPIQARYCSACLKKHISYVKKSNQKIHCGHDTWNAVVSALNRLKEFKKKQGGKK